MKFRKSGEEVRAALERGMSRDSAALQEAHRRFEKEKEKSALQLARDLELRIERFQRIHRHTKADETYELSEQDLVDFDI